MRLKRLSYILLYNTPQSLIKMTLIMLFELHSCTNYKYISSESMIYFFLSWKFSILTISIQGTFCLDMRFFYALLCVYIWLCLFLSSPGSSFPMPMPDSMNQPPGYSQYPSSSTQYGGSGFSGYPGPASSGYPGYPTQNYPLQYPTSTNQYGGGSNLPYPQYTTPGTNTGRSKVKVRVY